MGDDEALLTAQHSIITLLRRSIGGFTAPDASSKLIIMVRYRRRLEALCTALPDGTGVVLHLDKRCYYPLSKSGLVLWSLFDGEQVVDDAALADALVARYRIDRDVARRDIEAFVARLVAEDILAEVP